MFDRIFSFWSLPILGLIYETFLDSYIASNDWIKITDSSSRGGHGIWTTESRQGNEQTRTFDPANKSEDCLSAVHSYNFIIGVK